MSCLQQTRSRTVALAGLVVAVAGVGLLAWQRGHIDPPGMQGVAVVLAGVTAAALLALELLERVRARASIRRSEAGLCPRCAYDVSSAAGDVCPECGSKTKIADMMVFPRRPGRSLLTVVCCTAQAAVLACVLSWSIGLHVRRTAVSFRAALQFPAMGRTPDPAELGFEVRVLEHSVLSWIGELARAHAQLQTRYFPGVPFSQVTVYGGTPLVAGVTVTFEEPFAKGAGVVEPGAARFSSQSELADILRLRLPDWDGARLAELEYWRASDPQHIAGLDSNNRGAFARKYSGWELGHEAEVALWIGSMVAGLIGAILGLAVVHTSPGAVDRRMGN
jgi:hypothetical protein